MANPIPFLIDADASECGTLLCHVARANPQWWELAAVKECLVVFQGPQDYVTPSWYATKQETGRSCRPGTTPRSMPGESPP